jgi:hypothetical protein
VLSSRCLTRIIPAFRLHVTLLLLLLVVVVVVVVVVVSSSSMQQNISERFAISSLLPKRIDVITLHLPVGKQKLKTELGTRGAVGSKMPY